LTLPTARGSADYRKIDLADSLPRAPGVYLMKDRDGKVFYIGKAKNLRTRVRSYFYGDTRRRVAQMLRELVDIDHRVCETELEAEVTELRLIGAHRPRHNRRLRPPKSPHWVRLTDEAFPRLSMVRNPGGGGLLTIGPFSSQRSARVVVEAIWDAVPIRRCTHRPGSRPSRCGAAQMGLALCPADGSLTEADYRPVVDSLIAGIEREPELLLEPLAQRVADLARDRRFEEAGWARDRHDSLSRALSRRRTWLALQHGGLVRAEATDGTGALVERGKMLAAWADGTRPPLVAATPPDDLDVDPVPATMADASEAHLIWKWLTSGDVRLVDATGPLHLPLRRVATLDRIEV
ncbi:GIY-YIG nuclease family protein, partial [bacterium]|nr:GIY-YIG nuclease family protein [bacterium]